MSYLNFSITYADDPESNKEGVLRSPKDVERYLGKNYVPILSPYFDLPYGLRMLFFPDDLERIEVWHDQTRSLVEMEKERQRRALKGPPPPPSPPRRAPDLPMGRFEFNGFRFDVNPGKLNGTLEIRLVSDFGSGQILVIPINTNKVIIKQE